MTSDWKFRYLAVIGVATAIGCTGCAKHELVKQEQMIPVAAPAAPAQPAAPKALQEAQPAPTKDAGLAASALKESPATAAAPKSTGTEAADGAALKNGLEQIYFDFDSHTLSQAARATLAKNAELLKKQGSLKIRIEGNCDELGSDDYNLSLGQSRAKSAFDYLTSLGVPANRLSTISYGKEKPADPGHDEAARARNRRDEFVILAK